MESERQLAIQELEAAERARRRLRGSIGYPPGFLALMGVVGALIPLAALQLYEGVGAPWREVLGVVGVATAILGALAGLWGLRWFERHNRARIDGFRVGRAQGAVYVAGMLLIVVGVANRVDVAGWWWAPLVAAPLTAAATVGYLRWWLAGYRGDDR